MLIVLSPAKSLNYDTPAITDIYSLPEFIEHSAELVETLKMLSPAQLASLMSISDSLAVLSVTRYASWSSEFTSDNAKQAVLTFNGAVYAGLDASSLTAQQIDYVQSHVRILSGLHGVLRPLDLMQPYRLEMGTRLANSRGKDLYAFWGGLVTKALNEALKAQKSETLINLASEEYFKAVKPTLLKAQIITPVFEDWKNGKYKVISFYAKRARGMMARYAAVKRSRHPEKLKAFALEGYAFDTSVSTDSHWVFRRRVES